MITAQPTGNYTIHKLYKLAYSSHQQGEYEHDCMSKCACNKKFGLLANEWEISILICGHTWVILYFRNVHFIAQYAVNATVQVGSNSKCNGQIMQCFNNNCITCDNAESERPINNTQ